jgi:hypothetical protein
LGLRGEAGREELDVARAGNSRASVIAALIVAG